MLVPTFPPLTLGRAPTPFSHPDYLFEIKWDGFRSLVRIEQGKCRLISRKGNEFKSFPTLNQSLLSELKVRSAVLDGEIVCLNDAGKTEFRDLLFRRGEARFRCIRSALARRARFALFTVDRAQASTPLDSARGLRARLLLRSYGIRTIRNGLAARNFSTASGNLILIFSCGTIA